QPGVAPGPVRGPPQGPPGLRPAGLLATQPPAQVGRKVNTPPGACTSVRRAVNGKAEVELPAPLVSYASPAPFISRLASDHPPSRRRAAAPMGLAAATAQHSQMPATCGHLSRPCEDAPHAISYGSGSS